MADDLEEESGLSTKRIVGVVIAVALLIFVLQNSSNVSVHLFFFTVSWPMWLILAGTIILSMGVGYLLGGRGKTRKKK